MICYSIINMTFSHIYLDSNIFYCGTSRKILATVDTRSPNTVATIHNDSMVNTLYASRDGMHVITGDAHGVLKVWDIRSRKYWTCCHPELRSNPHHMIQEHVYQALPMVRRICLSHILQLVGGVQMQLDVQVSNHQQLSHTL